MRILFLTQILPYPLDAGPRIRAYYTLRHLALRHEVTLLSFMRADEPQTALTHLQSYCHAIHTVPLSRSRWKNGWHLARSLFGRTPFFIARDESQAMRRHLQHLIQQEGPFDAIHADQLWMAPYALEAKQLSGSQHTPTIVLDQHNAVFQIPLRLAKEAHPLMRIGYLFEAWKMKHYERRIVPQFDHVVWVSQEDQAAINLSAHLTPQANADVQEWIIPICVDPEQEAPLQRQKQAQRITFLGGLHWPPNAEAAQWLVDKVWPLIRQHVPDTILTIIGKNPPASLLAYQKKDPQVNVTGYISQADLSRYLTETAVSLAPLRSGGGIRLKILDAWCWGLPVVSTVIGAEGLQARHGEELLLADNPQAFAQAVVQVLQNPILAEHLSINGRQAIEKSYNWRQVYRAWDEIYFRF